MKKFYSILILLILTCNVFGQDKNVFQNFQKLMQEGKSFYQQKKYQEAYIDFQKATVLAPQSAEANFYLGRSALEIKNYDEAISAFDRVLMLNPNHIRTKLEIARVQYELKEYELANITLENVLQNPIPTDVKENILRFKEVINSKIQKNFVFGSVGFGIDYNDNANNDIGNIEFLVPAFDVSVKGNEKKGDTSAYINTVLNHIYDIGEKGGWSFNNSFTAYAKTNKQFSQNNALYFSLTVAPTYTFEKLRFMFPINYDKVFLEVDGYSHSFSLGARATYLVDTTSTLSLAYTLSNDYNEQNNNQDSRSSSVSISYNKAFGKQHPIILSLAPFYSISEKLQGGRTDVSDDSIGYNVGISKEIFINTNLAFNYTYTKKEYKDTDLLFGTKRSDNEKKYTLQLAHTFAKDVIVSLSGTYIDNQSNHPPYVYDKTLMNFNVTKRF